MMKQFSLEGVRYAGRGVKKGNPFSVFEHKKRALRIEIEVGWRVATALAGQPRATKVMCYSLYSPVELWGSLVSVREL